jgi:predicted permease
MSLGSMAGSFVSTLNVLLPSLLIIVAGYSLARWLGLSSAPLNKLLRYVFFPVYLFLMLEKRMSFDTFFFVALIGAAVVLVGFLIHRNAHRVLRAQIDASVAIPNVACFSIPIFALSWGGRGLGTACAFFVGVSIAAFLLERKDFTKLFREPWLYAAVTGILYNELRGSVQIVNDLLTPLMGATYPLLLLLLGVSLHPFEGMKDVNAWVTSVLRVVGGFLVALLGVTVLSVSPPIAAGAVMAAIAPPTTKSLSLAGPANDTPSSRGTSNVGLLVSLIVFIIFLATGWNPR